MDSESDDDDEVLDGKKTDDNSTRGGDTIEEVPVKGGDATGGGAVFSSDEPLYNRVLRKKLIGLLCEGCEGREIQYVVVGSSSSF